MLSNFLELSFASKEELPVSATAFSALEAACYAFIGRLSASSSKPEYSSNIVALSSIFKASYAALSGGRVHDFPSSYSEKKIFRLITSE